MPTLDAVAPSSAGQQVAAGTGLTWSHTCTGTQLILFVGVALSTNGAMTSAAVTYGGASMTAIGTQASDAQTAGGVAFFGLVGPAAGSASVAVSWTGSADAEGGSVSYTACDQTTGWTNVTKANGWPGSSPYGGSLSGVTSGDVSVAALAFGSPLTGMHSGMSRVLSNQNGTSGAGNLGIADSNGSGTVEIDWTSGSSDIFGWVAAEIIAGTGAAAVQGVPQVQPGGRAYRLAYRRSQQQVILGIVPASPVSDTDSGSGTDTQGLLASSAASDTGTGAEAQGLSASSSASDTGAGTEGQGLLASSSATDTGTGAESQAANSAAVRSSDTGTGAESQGSTAAVLAVDSGAGSEGTSFVSVTGTDTAAGAEGQSLSVSDADAGAGSEPGWLIQIIIPPGTGLSDAGAGSEAQQVQARTSAVDTGAGSEAQSAVNMSLLSVSDSDYGRGQEGDQTGYNGSDTGHGSELQVVTAVLVSSSDGGTGSDSQALRIAVQAVADADTGRGDGRHATNVTWHDADFGTGSDTLLASFSASSSDGGTGAEVASYALGVFPYPPAWLSASQSGYHLIFKPGTPHERVIRHFEGPSYQVFYDAQVLLEKIEYADSLVDVSDADSGSGSERHAPTASVMAHVAEHSIEAGVVLQAQLVPQITPIHLS